MNDAAKYNCLTFRNSTCMREYDKIGMYVCGYLSLSVKPTLAAMRCECEVAEKNKRRSILNIIKM